MKKIGTLSAALLLAAIGACRVNVDDGSSDDNGSPGFADLAGTYVTSAHGNSLDKDWSYSGALVLDSTGHFGTTLSIASDNDPPEQKSLRGEYRISHTTRHRRGKVIRTTKITLVPDIHHSNEPVLVVSGDSLKYSGPWWFNAGLGVLGIGDPVFVRESSVTSPDSSAAQPGARTASSTPASSKKSASAQPKKTPTSSPAAKK